MRINCWIRVRIEFQAIYPIVRGGTVEGELSDSSLCSLRQKASPFWACIFLFLWILILPPYRHLQEKWNFRVGSFLITSHVAVHLKCEHVGLENSDWFLVKARRTVFCLIPNAVYLWFKAKKKLVVDWVGISSWISSEFLRVLKWTLPGVKGRNSMFCCDKWCKYTLSKQSILTSWTVAFPVTLSPKAKFWAICKFLEPSGLCWILIIKKKKAEYVELLCFLCPFHFPLFFLFPIILLWCPDKHRRQTSCGSPRL